MQDYAKVLNQAQLEAATCDANATLVVAGAGSGKTRVIVYRLAWLIEHGVAPDAILLLTFTRKAAAEMLSRASAILGRELGGLAGGTFHAFAYGILRKYPPPWLKNRAFTLLDASDSVHVVKECRDLLKIGKKDPSFPKNQTIHAILSKARNKELSIEEILRRDKPHLLPHADAIAAIGRAYAAWLKDKSLLDYDDLLAELESLLKEDAGPARQIRAKYRHILVDEYQDTNPVQARIVRLLAQGGSRVMAVGDEAQSIYSFRGADVRNILDFPKMFPGARIIRLEENYRSRQPILDVANSILAHAKESFRKSLFTSRTGGMRPRLITPLSDTSQAHLVASAIEELLADYPPSEIAVLFRSGYHSYPLENRLRQAGIAFRKYGGMRLTEASHIKDVLSFARLALNPLDLPAFTRIAAMHKGVGPKTTIKLHGQLAARDVEGLRRSLTKQPQLLNDLAFIDDLRAQAAGPGEFFERLLNYYRPRLELLYPDDWPSRLPGLEELAHLAQSYGDLDLFVTDLALESPEEGEEDADCVTLSTVHSAKGLEWDAVLIIDLVEDRFPSLHSQTRDEEFEEERRLFYVACTRARKSLQLFAPASVYSRNEHLEMPVASSPFLKEIDPGCLDHFVEKYGGQLVKRDSRPANTPPPPDNDRPGGACAAPLQPAKTGYCRHAIFGRGKIVKHIDAEKVQVNFPGFGLKVILAEYLRLDG